MKLSVATTLTALCGSSLVAADLDPIVIKGSKFFYKTNGTQLYVCILIYPHLDAKQCRVYELG